MDRPEDGNNRGAWVCDPGNIRTSPDKTNLPQNVENVFPPSAIRTKFNFNLALALALALAWEFFSTEGAEPPALKKIPMPMPKPMPMPN